MKPEHIKLNHSKSEAKAGLNIIKKAYKIIEKEAFKRKLSVKVLTRVGAEIYAICATNAVIPREIKKLDEGELLHQVDTMQNGIKYRVSISIAPKNIH